MIINWYSKLFNSVCASMSSFFCYLWRELTTFFVFLLSDQVNCRGEKKFDDSASFDLLRVYSGRCDCSIMCVFNRTSDSCINSVRLTYHMTFRRRINARRINERQSIAILSVCECEFITRNELILS